MASTLKTEGVLERICQYGVIPVLVPEDTDHVRRLGIALRTGGLPVAEVTFRTAAAVDALRMLTLNPDMLVGAGSVITPEQVDVAYHAGARYIVSPGFTEAVVERCRRLGLPVIPGVATATDIIAAIECGITLVKFFPAEESGGLNMLRVLHEPFPGVRFIPTGGINSANAGKYLSQPFVAAVGGSWMIKPEHIRNAAFETITSLTAEAIQVVAKART
jgi:2-dehydro-3-deoxyphosphogluconate aldolase / (4S)-4-hydroxy-2-oxoglutarate aldolase